MRFGVKWAIVAVSLLDGLEPRLGVESFCL